MAKKKTENTTSETNTAATSPSTATPRKARNVAPLAPELQVLVDEAKAQQVEAKNKVGQIKKLNKLVTLVGGLDDNGVDMVIKILGDKRKVVFVPMSAEQAAEWTADKEEAGAKF